MNRNQAYQNHKLSDDLPTKELLHLGTNKLYYLIGNLLPKHVFKVYYIHLEGPNAL